MRSPLGSLLAASLLLAALSLSLTAQPPGKLLPREGLRVGMSPEQVQARYGPPARVARQILSQHYREQWLYDAPHHFRLDFDCPLGQKPTLRAFHLLAPR